MTPELQSQILSYEVLSENILAYVNRTDEEMVSKVPLFINTAEKAIYRRLRMPALERFVEVIIDEDDAANGYISIPTDYLEMKHIWEEGADGMIERTDYAQIRNKANNPEYSIASSTGSVSVCQFARVAGRFYFYPAPQEGAVIRFVYYKDTPELEPGQAPNDILLLAHDIILFRAVSEAFGFLREKEDEQYYLQKSSGLLEDLHQMVEEAEYSGSTLYLEGG